MELNSTNEHTSKPVRVRSITDSLNYSQVLRKKLIPDAVAHFEKDFSLKRFPKWVYEVKHRMNFCYFGMFMDFVVRDGLKQHLNSEFKDEEATPTSSWDKRVAEINNTVATMFGMKLFSDKQWISYIPTAKNIIKDIAKDWKDVIGEGDTIIYNSKLEVERVVGHPDVIVGNTILDIKCTSSAKKTLPQACLQILAYCALRRALGQECNNVGLVLVLHRSILVFDVRDWDHLPYLKLLQEKVSDSKPEPESNFESATIITDEDESITLVLGATDNSNSMVVSLPSFISSLSKRDAMSRIGTHIHKGKNLAISLAQFASSSVGRPCQVFLGPPQSKACSNSLESEVVGAAHVVATTGLNCFVHTRYIINLCANLDWAAEVLKKDLVHSVAIGCKGVVVHTGARVKRTEKEAMDNMVNMIADALQYATEDCPLLLETPAGEGTELCTTLEELNGLFLCFSEEQRKKLGVCIDSAHTWGSGYCPLNYIQRWVKETHIPIKLVHFNGSRVERGSRKDRHSPAGGFEDKIGWEIMGAIAKLCGELEIPCVVE
jgi:deoxyribonuclease IV